MADPFDRDPSAAYGLAEPVEGVPGVVRITARNPSPMTFSGTRSYLVGRSEIAVIDPGPEDPAHRAAILAAVPPGGRITRILLTHTHVDHSTGAHALAAETGAPIQGFGPHGAGMSDTMRRLAETGAELGGGEGADTRTRPDRLLADGEPVEGEGWALRALWTPGHLSNHLCFALEGMAEGRAALFTGDTVMGWATTLVSPPEGDMAALMASLRRLATRKDEILLPGHGHAVRDPGGMIAHQIAHREARAAAIRAALEQGPANAAQLAAAIYTDTPPALLPAAERNVFATLIGLMDQGEAHTADPLSPAARFVIVS